MSTTLTPHPFDRIERTAPKRQRRKRPTRTIEAFEIQVGDTITIPGHWANGKRYDDKTVKVTQFATHKSYTVKIGWIHRNCNVSMFLHPELEVTLVRRPRRK